ncbi:MAG: hypothetical protein QOK02_6115 [Mycobacterium sp.]|jgi:hypothetical protein|nr:hypothetical protein [Mycobacterium sp.]
MTNDVEKRWRDPGTLRAAMIYVAVVVALAAAACAGVLLFGRGTPSWAWAPPLILFAGGVGAFGKTYQVWRARGTWPIWHGAGWFLLTLMLVSLALPGAVISNGG